MSWEAAGFVKKQLQCPDGAALSRGQKLILFVLADYHDTKRRMTWPSVVTIAEESLSSLAQTKRDLAYLEEHCVIVRSRNGVGATHRYSYRFVGLDLDFQEALQLRAAMSQERVQGEPFNSSSENSERVHGRTPFCPDGKGSERVHKGSMVTPLKGSQRVHGEQRYKEEPEPSTKPEPEPRGCAALRVEIPAQLLTHLPRATGGVIFNDGRTFLFADGYVWQVRDDGELLVKLRSAEFHPNDRNAEAPDAVKSVLCAPSNRKQATA